MCLLNSIIAGYYVFTILLFPGHLTGIRQTWFRSVSGHWPRSVVAGESICVKCTIVELLRTFLDNLMFSANTFLFCVKIFRRNFSRNFFAQLNFVLNDLIVLLNFYLFFFLFFSLTHDKRSISFHKESIPIRKKYIYPSHFV